MSSDQKFSTLTADGNFKTITGGSTNIGACRVTYIQAHGGSDCLVKLPAPLGVCEPAIESLSAPVVSGTNVLLLGLTILVPIIFSP